MHVVYCFVRKNLTRTAGYPPTTIQLSKYLFPTDEDVLSPLAEPRMVGGDGGDPEDMSLMEPDHRVRDLSHRIVTLFNYVMCTDSWAPMDATLAHLFRGNDGPLMQFVEKNAAKQPGENDKPKLFVLALDEARALLPEPLTAEVESPAAGWFRILRRALTLANDMIRAQDFIIASLVDTNSKISNFVPVDPRDPSQRLFSGCRLHDPFVLTDTIDVFQDLTKATQLEAYARDVLIAVGSLDSTALLRELGRPLWRCLDSSIAASKASLVSFAAMKLLGGEVGDEVVPVLGDANLNDIPAMLCRVGIRPYSKARLASRVVADYMALLIRSDVDSWRDVRVASRSSVVADKILPEFGKLLLEETLDTGGIGEVVARVVLLLAMDACGVLEDGRRTALWLRAGEFHDVWTLLRALHGDSPALKIVNKVELEIEEDRLLEAAKKRQKNQAGEIAPVVAMPKRKMLRVASAHETQAALDELEAQWKDAFVSFTHFLQLANEPTMDCLWAMLARQAAGIFPRGHKGADLIIPILRYDKSQPTSVAMVSMLLVQVKNREDADASFPGSAIFGVRPENVFAGDQLKSAAPDQVLRLHMSFRGRETASRFYLRDDHKGSVTAESESHSYIFCIQNLSEWITTRELPPPSLDVGHEDVVMEEVASLASIEGGKEGEVTDDAVRREATSAVEREAHDVDTVTVLSASVVAQLNELLTPWWSMYALVEDDEKKRIAEETILVPAAEQVRRTPTAARPLAENLLLNDAPARTGTGRSKGKSAPSRKQ